MLYIQIIIQSRLDQSMEENQDLKVCQDMYILLFEEKNGNVTHKLWNSNGERERDADLGLLLYLYLFYVFNWKSDTS